MKILPLWKIMHLSLNLRHIVQIPSLHWWWCIPPPPPPSPYTSNKLLQPSSSHYSDPRSLAILSKCIFSFLVTDPDTMTMSEALQQDDKEQFLEVTKKEIGDYISQKLWKFMSQKYVPQHKSCLFMVWSMKLKWNPIGEILKNRKIGYVRENIGLQNSSIVGEQTFQLSHGRQFDWSSHLLL